MLEALGQMTWKHRGREVELTIDLPEVEAAARVRPLLWQFAIGAVDPGRSLLERLWPRRRAALGGPLRNLIVVGTGGSGHAAAAVEAAAAAASNATLEVVGVQRFLLPEQPEVMAAAWAAVEELRGRGLAVGVLVRRGGPALVLADVAAEENARLIVVGAGEHSKLARRLLGSVADLVAERSPCNVLIIRPDERS